MTYKGISIMIFQLIFQQKLCRSEGNDGIYLKVMKGKNLQPRSLYPARISFRFGREIKTFTDNQNLREFNTTTAGL